MKAEHAALRAQVERLAAQVQELQELQTRLAKDSHHSSKPPSSDRLGRKTKRLRTKSGKKAGGQVGHREQTLHLVAAPDVVLEHRPAPCHQCHASLEGAAVVLRERRQVHELPPVRLCITHHQAVQLHRPAGTQVSRGAFPAEVPSRVQDGSRLRALAVYLVEGQFVPFGRTQQLLSELLGVRLARGSVVGWVEQAARTLQPVDAALKAALRQASVLHNDETGVRRAGRLA